MNGAEEYMKDRLEKKGYLVLRNGWPDFLVIDKKRGFGFAVEVKEGADKIRPEQELMHRYLGMLGLPIFIAKDRKISEWRGSRLLDTPMRNRITFELDMLKERFRFFEAEFRNTIRELELRLERAETGTDLEP